MNAWEKDLVIYCKSGLEAEKFLFENLNIKNEIKFCMGSFNRGDFHGIPIYSLDDVSYISKYRILVVGGEKEIYETLKQNLLERGLKEFENFIWAATYKKKLVCINANCHGMALAQYLKLSKNFCKDYIIYPVPNIHLNTEKKIANDLLKEVDVFIHQDIRVNNSIAYELSDEYCQKQLSPSCKDIVIPNLVGFGDWLYPNLAEVIKYDEKYNLVFRDKILDQAYCDIGEDRLKLYLDYYNGFSYSDAFLQDLYKRVMGKLKEREKNWNVKIVSFIEDNFREIPMFVDAGHPSRYLMIEIGRQVLELLNLENDIDVSMYMSELGMPTPLSMRVKDYWKIDYKKDMESRKSYMFTTEQEYDEDVYLRQYIMEYVWWLYGIKLKE